MPSLRLHTPSDHQPEDRPAVCETLDHLEMYRETGLTLGDPADMENPSHDLSSATKTSYKPADDPYRRPKLDHTGPVKPEDNVKPPGDHYVVEKLFEKRTSQGWT